MTHNGIIFKQRIAHTKGTDEHLSAEGFFSKPGIVVKSAQGELIYYNTDGVPANKYGYMLGTQQEAEARGMKIVPTTITTPSVSAATEPKASLASSATITRAEISAPSAPVTSSAPTESPAIVSAAQINPAESASPASSSSPAKTSENAAISSPAISSPAISTAQSSAALASSRPTIRLQEIVKNSTAANQGLSPAADVNQGTSGPSKATKAVAPSVVTLPSSAVKKTSENAMQKSRTFEDCHQKRHRPVRGTNPVTAINKQADKSDPAIDAAKAAIKIAAASSVNPTAEPATPSRRPGAAPAA